MDNFIKTERIYTILELNSTVRRLLKSEFPDAVWVCGEIQDFRASRDRRHIYFNLAQKHPEADEIIAKANAAIFQNRKPLIFKRLQEADLSFELKDDIKVKLLCELDLYPKTGSFSLIVVDIDPIYTLGKIAQNRQRIIEELKVRGLLDKNKLLRIPTIPLKIGLITSFDSAAYHDFANELKGSGYGFKIFLCDCYMQGKFVEKDVLRALRLFNNLPMNKTPPSKVSGGSTCARKGIPMDKLDVVVITRGGGSTADLSYFDNKRVAEAVANSKFPVISALGHQINITIVDMAAHTTLKTPTKAAQFLVELVGEFVEGLNYLEQQIVRKTEDLFKIKKGGLETMAVKMDSILSHYFRFHEQQLLEKKLTMLNSLKAILVKKRQKLERIFEGCKAASSRIFKSSQDYIEYIKEKIKLLDPGNILRRGYSITFKDKKVLKSVDDLMEKDYIRTILHKGSIISEVKRKEGGND